MTLLFHGLVGSNSTVGDVDDAVGMLRNVVFVGDQNDGVSLAMEILEQRHDFVAGLGAGYLLEEFGFSR